MTILIKKTEDLEKKIDESRFAQPASLEKLRLKEDFDIFFLYFQVLHNWNLDTLIDDYGSAQDVQKDYNSFADQLKNKYKGDSKAFIRDYYETPEKYKEIILKKDHKKLANNFYHIKVHNGFNEVLKNKMQIIRDYKDYLNQVSLTEEQKEFLRNTYFKEIHKKDPDRCEISLEKGNITNEVAGYLWCMWPSKEKSYDTAFENNVKGLINGIIKRIT